MSPHVCIIGAGCSGITTAKRLAEFGISYDQFELSDDAERVRKTSAIVMVPTLDNEIAKGVQMPLRVSLAPREE